MNSHSSYSLTDLRNNILPENWNVEDREYKSQIIFSNQSNNEQIVIQKDKPANISLFIFQDTQVIEPANITDRYKFSKLDDAIDKAIYVIFND